MVEHREDHDDLEVIAMKIQATWRGKVARRAFGEARAPMNTEQCLRRLTMLMDRMEQRMVRLEKQAGTLPVRNAPPTAGTGRTCHRRKCTSSSSKGEFCCDQVPDRLGQMHKEVKGGMPAGYRVPKANKGAHAFRDAASKITASERLLMAAVKPKTDVSRGPPARLLEPMGFSAVA